MTAPPNEGYFHWLVSQTEMPLSRNPNETYWSLLHQLHNTQFRWFVHNDDNRGEAGKELRDEYLGNYDIDGEDLWIEADASLLEVLVALSRDTSFQSEGAPCLWFWRFIENLDLQHYTDAHWHYEVEQEVNEVLVKLLERVYSPDGRGGLFPLRRAQTDQRRVELWYQMAAYLLEGNYVADGP